MLRKFAYLVPALALFLLPAIAQAQFEQGNWTLTLNGAGTADRDFRGTANTAFSVNGSAGYFMTHEAEVEVRQGLLWADGGSLWAGDTRAAFDWHFDFDRLWPYIGANLGYVYYSSANKIPGTGINDHWEGGPEIGAKYFLNSTTFVDASFGYDFDLQQRFSQGHWVYGVGLGVKF